ncbi:hypothetical protein L249_0471 [Ophiocordyceps polyrhachis-furcata BCC 54312]|uniref:N-acetyltransferase domain-containing protein n=1 Tax=Ophiocordyceps polyrhachis-furcata BCC 54312 TaxID=1330021 RepID=A0A367LD58_9HYPO|nr:hypothetical protein L249_0471 [Ophiocordyceps polyrhachis-furcata BCC 54312]
MASSSPPPPLTFELALTPDGRRDALRLVADSIAQQRQVAALAIIFHPLCLAALVAGCALVWRHSGPDLGSSLVTASGLVMAYLAAVRLYTAPFLRLAEGFDCASFLAADDLVLVARFGPDLIGTLVLRLDDDDGGEGLIRAWTTLLRFRRKGIGADLLRYAVTATRTICGDAASLAFDPDHANASVPVNGFFRRPFTVRDEKAAKALKHALRDCDANNGGFAPVEDHVSVRKRIAL